MHNYAIIGLSPAMLSMIIDAIYSNGRPGKIVVINNLNLNAANIPIEAYKKIFQPPIKIDLQMGTSWLAEHSYLIDGVYKIILGVNTPAAKQSIVVQVVEKHKAINIGSLYCHPFYISMLASIGNGLFLGPNTSVAAHASIGNYVSINRNASIGHHTILQDYVTISPGAVVCGKCTIGAGTTIGAGAVIKDNITIGKNCFIGAGSVVTKNIEDNITGWGNPFKAMRASKIIIPLFC